MSKGRHPLASFYGAPRVCRSWRKGAARMVIDAPQRAVGQIRALRLGGLLQRGFWGLCDQALISASNFMTTVVLARNLDRTDFGAFALVYAAIVFANSVQSALVTQPHNILGATRGGDDYRRYTTITAMSQLCLAALMALIALLSAVIAREAAWGIAPLLFPLVPAIVAWQLQEFVRRVLYTEGRLRAAMANDAVSYGTQAVAMVTLGRLGYLTGGRALAIVALTSAVAAAFGLWQIKDSLSRRGVWASAREHGFTENWRFGKWLFGAALALWVSGQLYPVLVGGLVSIAEAGTMRAVVTILGPTHILLIAMDTALAPAAARAYAERGQPGLQFFLKRVVMITAPVMGAYCLLIALFAAPILVALYGEQDRRYGWLLACIAFSYALSYLRSPVVIALEARRASAPIFQAHLWSSLVVLTAGVAAVRLLGLFGAALGTIANSLILSLFLWRRYRRIVATDPDAESGRWRHG